MSSRRRPAPPSQFREIRANRVHAWARPAALPWVADALSRYGSLYEAARHEAGGSTDLHGRAPVFVVETGGSRWAVRHYMRGGAVASYLGDRYLDLGEPRPFSEARASERVRAAGLPTPMVQAASVYRSGLFYRADLVTEYVPDAADLAELLFVDDPEAGSSLRRAALEASGRLVRRLAEAGIHHPDVNVKNLLVQAKEDAPPVHLIDLDGCRIRPVGSPDALRRSMRKRLLRSIRKWERSTGRALSPVERDALEHGFSGA